MDDKINFVADEIVGIKQKSLVIILKFLTRLIAKLFLKKSVDMNR